MSGIIDAAAANGQSVSEFLREAARRAVQS